MKKINTVIIDSDNQFIAAITKMLKADFPEIDIVASATTITEGERLIHLHQPDLIIIDIDMHKGDDFQLFDNLLPNHYHIIFTSFTKNVFIGVTHYTPIDYLLKPIDKDALNKAINTLNAKMKEEINIESIVNAAGQLLIKSLPIKIIYLISNGNIKFLKTDEIMYFSTLNDAVVIHMMNGQEQVSTKTLIYYEILLSNNYFIRIHNNTLVNPQFIDQYNKGNDCHILLINKTNLPVSEK